MSSRRSRKGGTVISRTLSRYSRSSRNARGRRVFQVAVGSRDDAHVRVARVVVAQTFELLLLQKTEELRLQVGGDLRNLVEKQRPASADSTRPTWSRTAPVKAPFTWPKSSLARSSPTESDS